MKQLGGPFEKDKEIFKILSIVARTYNCLPTDLLRLTWQELLFNIQCAQIRSEELHKMLGRQNRKKAMLFPNISITELVDIL